MGILKNMFGGKKQHKNDSVQSKCVVDTSIFRKGWEFAEHTEGKVVFDLYKGTTAVEEGNSFHETTIHEMNGALYLNIYSGDNSGVLDHKSFVATPELAEELLHIVDVNRIKEWNLSGESAETGSITAVKYMDADGKTVRVSSEKMPSEGDKIISSMRKILTKYIESKPVSVKPAFDHSDGMYYIDYHDQKELFHNAEDKYPEGADVELNMDMIALDLNYTFYVDGKEYPAKWDSQKSAYVIRFSMPSKNIEVYFVTDDNGVVQE